MPDIYGRLACKGGWYIYPIDIEVTCPQYIAQAVDTDTRSAIARQFFRGGKEIAINDDGMAEVNRTKLYYEVKGKGDDLVLLHDGLLGGRIWDDQLGSFVRHFKVILYDRRGYGRSEIPKERFSDVRDLQSLLRFLVEGAYLLGSSNGGGVALDFALLSKRSQLREAGA